MRHSCRQLGKLEGILYLTADQQARLVGELCGENVASLDVDPQAVDEGPGCSTPPDGAHLAHAAGQQLKRGPYTVQHT